MEQSNASTKGKGLGMAGMIIGIVCGALSIIPGVAIFMIIFAIVGLILSLVGFMQAKKAGNPKKGAMIAGIILNIIVIGLAIFYTMYIASKVGEGLDKWNDAAKQIQDSINAAH